MSRRKQQKPHAVRKDDEDEEISTAVADVGGASILADAVSDQDHMDDEQDETASDVEDDEASNGVGRRRNVAELLQKAHLNDKDGTMKNGSARYVCTYCPTSYDTFSQVQIHEQEHADIMPFRCTYCAKGFKHKRSVDRHLKLHVGEKKYKCQRCQTAFFRSDHLKLHLKTHEPSKHQYSCHVCHRGFYSPAGLESHAAVHKLSENSESGKADSPINTDSLFSDMMRVMVSQDDEIGGAGEKQCVGLPNVNDQSEILTPSSSLNLNSNPDKAVSPSQTASTASGDLQAATLAQSAPPSSITCSVCAALFADVDSLQAHTLRRHSLNEIERQPPSSMGTFFTAGAHNIGADDDPVYTCDRCRRVFDSILALHSHAATCGSTTAASGTPAENAGAVGANNNGQIYQCSQCDVSLSSLKAFTAHMRQHMQTNNNHQNLAANNSIQNNASPPSYFNCDLCPMVFADQSNLESHLVTHYLRKENQYICTDCVENRNSTRIFATKEEIFKHLYDSHAQMIYRCTVCHETFDSREDLQVHFSIHHTNEIGRFRCRSCNALYASDDQFRAHVNAQHRPKVPGAGANFLPPVNHLNQLPFTCPICLETFAVEYLFDKHVELVHKPNFAPKKVYCSGNNATSQQSLQKCNICDEKFKDLDQLTKHKLDRHCKVRSEQCNVCKESVFTVEQFFQHCRLHTIPGCHVTTCVICKQSLNSIVEMQAHAKFHCSDSQTKFTVIDTNAATVNQFKRYQCLKCPLTFGTELQIQSHVAEHVMQDGLDHQCHLCPESRRVTFDSPAKLQRHLVEHSYHRISNTNEHENQSQQFLAVEYKCQMCNVKFDDVNALQNHVTSSGVHTRPYECRYCDQKYFFDTELENHVIGFHRTMINGTTKLNEETNGTSPIADEFCLPVTTTPNAFVCPLCGVAFNAMSTLKSHTAQCKRKMFYNNTAKSPSPAAATASSTPSNGSGGAKTESQSLLAQLMMTPNTKTTPSTSTGRNRRSSTAAATAAASAPGSFPCPNCPKVFPSMSALQGHSHVHMNTIKAFGCDQCDKTFQTTAKLRNHQRQHSGDKPYMCHICARYFSRRDNLKVHMKTHYKSGAPAPKTSDFATSMVVQPSVFGGTIDDQDGDDEENFQAADVLMASAGTESPSSLDQNFSGQNSENSRLFLNPDSSSSTKNGVFDGQNSNELYNSNR